jgi:guanylate kinase
MKGIIFLLAGPSGSGKNTVLDNLLRNNHRLIMPRGVWTRPQRSGVNEDSDTISMGQFHQMLVDGELTGMAEFSGNLYAVPRANIRIPVEKGLPVIRIVTIDGVQRIKDDFPDCVVKTIFLFAPIRVLRQRLIERGDHPIDIERRMVRAKIEMSDTRPWDLQVNTDNPLLGTVMRVNAFVRDSILDHQMAGSEVSAAHPGR